MPVINGTKFTAYGEELEMRETCYANKRIAIKLQSTKDGAPWGVLTVNVPDVHLDDGEILVKTWSENKPFRAPALATGLFQDTGKRVPAGYAQAEIWRMMN